MTFGKLSLQFWSGQSMVLNDVAVEQVNDLLVISDRQYGSKLAYSLDRLRNWSFDDTAVAAQSCQPMSSASLLRH